MFKLAHFSRRQFLTLPGLSLATQARARGALRVICIGAHPDDPESGCGGTVARYVELGHEVTIVYLTRGESGVRGKSWEEAAGIRTNEAERACEILGAKPVFAGHINGAVELTEQRVASFVKLVLAKAPDVVLTHWPIDTHLDHQVASLLTFRAYVVAPRKFQLYYFEVNAGSQTLAFHPTDYVDITSVREKKRAALFAHKSQNGEGIYRQHHEIMESFRGREAGVTAAEAFVRLNRSAPASSLPGFSTIAKPRGQHIAKPRGQHAYPTPDVTDEGIPLLVGADAGREMPNVAGPGEGGT